MGRNNDIDGNRDEAQTSNINKSQELWNLRGVANKKMFESPSISIYIVKSPTNAAIENGTMHFNSETLRESKG
jgi:hypothetical protein